MVLISREEPFKSPPKGKLITQITVGLFLITLSVLPMFFDPMLMFAKYYFRVAPGSYVFNIFQSEVDGARMALTIFNITNAEQFMSGQDHKLKVNEVGPFTYMERRQNIDTVLDMKAKRMYFTPSIKLRFLPDESVGYPEDVNVTVANTVLLSAASLLQPYSFWVQQAFNILANQYSSKSIVTVNADTYLWGLEDPIIQLANRVAPGLIFFDKLGIMDRLYDNKTFFRLELGISDEDKFSVKTLERYLKNQPKEYPPIDRYTFNETYEGVAYRTDIKQNTPLNIYRLGVCKTFELGFQSKVTMDYGPEAWLYRITNQTFNRDCQSKRNKCGLLDLAPCLYGIPLSLSRTHFLYSDPMLYERIEGMNPDEKIHDSIFTIDPKIGFELDTSLSIQLNLVLGDLSFNRQARPLSNLVLPIAHIKVTQPELFDDIKFGLKILHVTAPAVLITLQIIMMIGGLSLLGYTMRHVLGTWLPAGKRQLKVTSEKQMLPLMHR